MMIAMSGVIGLLLGSFFNVLIYRIPKGESIVFPASHCPACNTRLRPWQNIPLVSYLFLKGACASCKKAIPLRYPLVEALTALASIVLFLLYIHPQLHALVNFWQLAALLIRSVFLLLLIPIAFIDYDHLIIPDSLSYSSIITGCILAFFPNSGGILNSLWGMLCGGGTLFFIGIIGKLLFKKESMGMGDIKLMLGFGALFGPAIALYGIMFGSCIGAFIGIGLMITGLLKKGVVIPFGPFLAGGIWIGILFGDTLFTAYKMFILRIGA